MLRRQIRCYQAHIRRLSDPAFQAAAKAEDLAFDIASAYNYFAAVHEFFYWNSVPEDILLVLGYKKEQVVAAFPDYAWCEQSEQLGTGHAAGCGMKALGDYEGDVLVGAGDMPLLTRDTYLGLLEEHRRAGNACTILTGTADIPSKGYGRVLRNENGEFVSIVEEKDCTPRQREIRELNSAVYVFDAAALRRALGLLKNENAQGEYYLTDTPTILMELGEKVGVCCRHLGKEILGVNTPQQLSEVEEALLRR